MHEHPEPEVRTARFNAHEALELSPDALAILNERGRVLDANQRFAELFGRDAPSIHGTPVEALISSTGDSTSLSLFGGAALGEGSMCAQAVRADGGCFLVELSFARKLLGGERVVALAVRDVTERERRRRKFEALIEAAPDAILAVDRYGVIRIVNAQLERLFGYPRAELIGREVEILIPEPSRSRHPRYRANFFASPQVRAMGSGRTLLGLRKDGTEFPIEISLSPIETDGGTLVASAIRDLTERVKAEDRFRSLLESAPDAMVIVDGNGRIVLANAQTVELFGYQREELIGQWVELLMPERYRERHPSHRDQYYKEPRVRGMGAGLELFGRRKDGTEFPIEISLSPLRVDDGVLVSSAIRDITDRKRMEHTLQRANRLKSEFLANMSHELRTPMNAILGFAALIHDDEEDPVSAAHKEYLGDILASGQHLLRLINDVLDLAKVESGKLDFHFETVDIERLIGDVRDILRGVIATKRLRFAIDVAPDAQRAVLDPARIKQILYNLLSNAMKFTPERGRITVRTRCEGDDYLRIEVADTGIGIPPADFGRLFVEFEQLDGGTTKRHAGTGLGLVLTKRIVEAQGGYIEVRSAKGYGSTFCAVLPRLGSLCSTPLRRPRFTVASPLTILLVGYDDSTCRRLSALLHDISEQVDVAESPAIALQCCERSAYDAFVLDPLQRELRAGALLASLRATVLNVGVPAFALTACDDVERASAFRLEDMLPKRLGEQALLQSVQQALADQKQRAVLVLDDDPSALRLIEAGLRPLGHRVFCTQSAAEALEVMRREPLNLLVLDLLMPGLDGFEFISLCQQLPGARAIPIVIWTAKDLTPDEEARLAQSASAIVAKATLTTPTIIDQIRAVLDHEADPQESEYAA